MKPVAYFVDVNSPELVNFLIEYVVNKLDGLMVLGGWLDKTYRTGKKWERIKEIHERAFNFDEDIISTSFSGQVGYFKQNKYQEVGYQHLSIQDFLAKIDYFAGIKKEEKGYIPVIIELNNYYQAQIQQNGDVMVESVFNAARNAYNTQNKTKT